MGNRAVITTRDKELGVYVHWNGGRDSVEGFIEYCRLRGFRAPENDCYGWARLCQIIGNFFGGGLSVGIDLYSRIGDAGDDNGVYVIEDWRIVDRILPYKGFKEQRSYDPIDVLEGIDESQPEGERLGKAFIHGTDTPTEELEVGDKVFVHDHFGGWAAYEIKGFTMGTPYRPALPLIERYPGGETNHNNILREKVYRKANDEV